MYNWLERYMLYFFELRFLYTSLCLCHIFKC